jgi:transposase
VRKHPKHRDTGQRPGPTTAEVERVNALERKLREENEILHFANAVFTLAELGCHFKP